MSPGNARRVLIQRRNWLLAKESPGRRDQAELSALERSTLTSVESPGSTEESLSNEHDSRAWPGAQGLA